MQTTMDTVLQALAIAIFLTLVVLLAWFAAVRLARKPKPGQAAPATPPRIRELVESRDGHPSLSKFQFLVWTAVILPVFVWIYFIRLLSGVVEPIAGLPTNILALMGISVVSVPVSDKVSQLKYGDRPWRRGEHLSLWSMLMEFHTTKEGDPGVFSLARFQMFMWTFISVAIYVFVVYTVITKPATLTAVETLTLPDIDPALVVLMGLSQTGYIGAKATLPDRREKAQPPVPGATPPPP